MTFSKCLTAVALLATVLFANRADAAQSCVFYSTDSVFHLGSSQSSTIYGYGPVSFVWEPATERILGGYFIERATIYDPVYTYFNNVTGGSISGSIDPSSLDLSIPYMSFVANVQEYYEFYLEGGSLTGTSSEATFTGNLDGPNWIEAIGTVTCH